METTYKPILRQIDLIPGEYEGTPVIFLRDPIGFVDEIIALPRGVIPLLMLMDGEHDLRDLQVELSKQMGEIIPLEEIVRLIKFLDEKGFLWSDTFENLKEKVYENWFQQKVRLMAHANSGYPLDQEEASQFIEGILKLAQPEDKSPPRILIAPHIDLRVGARAYAEAYQRFKIPPGSRIIIIGVGHYLDYPYSVLTKDIATPFGPLRNDRGGLLYLLNSKRIELFPDHIAHKLEHSIEFQALFLRYLQGDNIVALPFLIGSHRFFMANPSLLDNFVAALLDLMDDRTYLLFGIDFCHLGLRYGDPYPVTKSLIEEALKIDRTLLELAMNGEKEEIEKLFPKIEPFKICGTSALYLLSQFIAMGKFQGSIEIFYQEFLPFGEGSGVSVASAGYYF